MIQDLSRQVEVRHKVHVCPGKTAQKGILAGLMHHDSGKEYLEQRTVENLGQCWSVKYVQPYGSYMSEPTGEKRGEIPGISFCPWCGENLE